MSYWTVAKTLPQREHVAAQCLAWQRFDTYLPLIQILRPNREPRIAPLFPNYLFVLIGETGRWYQIGKTIGVARVLCDMYGPVRLPHQEIAKIKKRERNGFVVLPKPRPRWVRGEKIRIARGAFRDHFAIYDGMCAADRHCILMNLLGRSVRMEVSDHDLLPLAF